MKKQFFLLLVFFGCGLIHAVAQNIVFPPAAEGTGWVDVTKAPYFAPNDGIGDATAALNAALVANIGSGRRIYLPNGTYLISNTIVWPDQANGNLPSGGFLQGQSTAGVVIKLKNNCPGFTNAATPKAMLVTGHDVAQDFVNCVKNVTINTGKGNVGAIGLRYYANNTGTSSDIAIVSGDKQGVIGLDLNWQNENGPLLVKNISITGFNIGVNAGSCQNSQTIEHLTLRNQLQYGIKNNGGILSIRDLKSYNQVQAVNNSGVMTIIGASLKNGEDPAAAIANSGVLYVRSLKAVGYSRGIDNTGGNGQSLTDLSSPEWNSHNQISLNPGKAGMLKLPINETPDMIWDDVADWQVVNTPGDGVADASDAIQAAIDAGKTTVYMLPGFYKVTKPIYVRGNVRTLFGFGCILDVYPGGGFVVQEGTYDTVVFDNWGGGYRSSFFCTQASSRTVAIKNTINWGVKKNPNTGDLYLEDLSVNPFAGLEFYGGNVWARQLNPEYRNKTKIISSATDLWILGLKTEWGQGGATLIDTRNGGKTEVCGFFSYNVVSPGAEPMFIVNESKFSAVGMENANDASVAYTTFVRETISGITKNLTASGLPPNCSPAGKMLPYYVSNTINTTVPVTGITVTPKPLSVPVNRTATLTGTVAPANATNKTVVWSSGNTGVATVDILTGVVTGVSLGTVIITGSAQDGGDDFTDSTLVTVIPNPFSGTVTTSSASVDLTSIGTADWAHWPGYDHKASGGSKISNFTIIGSGSPGSYSGDARAISWSDGIPTAGGSNNTSGHFMNGVGNGLSITVPASPTSQTLTVYCGVYAGQGRFTAHLSDGSYPDYVDESIVGNGTSVDANYTIVFKAGSANQTLTVSWVLLNGGGNVTLHGAALMSNIAVTGIALSPSTATVQLGTTTTLAATIAPATATNKTVIWSSGNTAVATVSGAGVVTGVSVGSATITGKTQDGNFAATATITVTPNPFTGTVTTSSTAVDLTAIGTTDWAHWPGYDHKGSGGGKISNFTLIGSGSASTYSGDARAISWNDGTPTASSSGNTSGNYIGGGGNGYSITVPAGPASQTFVLYCGVYAGQGKLTAHLSDNSSPDYIDESIVGNGTSVDANYTIVFKAGSANQTLTVSWVLLNGGGNVTLHGAALMSGGSGARTGSSAAFLEGTPTREIIRVYPNPVTSVLHVKIPDVGETGNVDLTLYDLTGKSVYTSQFKAVGNQTDYTLDCSPLPKGMYFLRLNGIKAKGTYKVIIQ